jgi:hypothetical protein
MDLDLCGAGRPALEPETLRGVRLGEHASHDDTSVAARLAGHAGQIPTQDVLAGVAAVVTAGRAVRSFMTAGPPEHDRREDKGGEDGPADPRRPLTSGHRIPRSCCSRTAPAVGMLRPLERAAATARSSPMWASTPQRRLTQFRKHR